MLNGEIRFEAASGVNGVPLQSIANDVQNCYIYPWPYQPTTPVVPYPYYPAYPEPAPQRMGWICPKCNKGVSPDQQTCPCDSVTITWETTCGPEA